MALNTYITNSYEWSARDKLMYFLALIPFLVAFFGLAFSRSSAPNAATTRPVRRDRAHAACSNAAPVVEAAGPYSRPCSSLRR